MKLQNRLVTDGDGHWYIIPDIQADQWNFLVDTNQLEDLTPIWAIRVGGYHVITFNEWSEDYD